VRKTRNEFENMDEDAKLNFSISIITALSDTEVRLRSQAIFKMGEIDMALEVDSFSK
jgi:hypothetical protein